MSTQLAAFLGIAILLIMTPGPDMALVLRNALLAGRRPAIYTACGVVTGLAGWTLAASAGVTALLLASQPAFLVVKLVGAAYLFYLGAKTLRGVLRSGQPPNAAVVPATRPLSAGVAYRQGIICNLGNPKAAVIFTSLLPQFAPGGHSSFAGLLALGLIFCSLALIWLTSYASLVSRAGDLLRRPRVRRAIEGCTGLVLVGLGLRLATERS
jgi:threonine/homoserine/homoserine lactone efflux protein